LASGELHLTGLLLLGPHLTDVNLVEVLSRAKHRTKREILRLVRILDPLPAVPARIEPLGPAPATLARDVSPCAPDPSSERTEQVSLPNQDTVQLSSAGRRAARTGPRGRHIPAAVRRAVFERDGKQCSYLAATGKRCVETRRLEVHHLKPFAAGGEHSASNLTLRCRAHNALAAEADFGHAFIEGKKRSIEHEPLCDSARVAVGTRFGPACPP
jgi:5-methylcytosine-specific restriction endonuclease McrA